MQRVAIGRALVRRPKALLMDEPIGALDAKLREDMRAELKRLHIENGTTSVYVTHDQVEAMSLADRVAVMNDGVLQQVGTPTRGLPRPANLFVAQFVGVAGDEHRRRRDRAAATARRGCRSATARRLRASRRDSRRGSTLSLPAGHDLVLGVRPEGGAGCARGRRRALRQVEAHFIEPLGAYDIVDLKIGERLPARPAPQAASSGGAATASGRGSTRRRCISSTPATGESLNIRLGHDMAEIPLDRRHQALRPAARQSTSCRSRIADGEFFVLLGPTGAGKTTTLRLIAGLEMPTKRHRLASAARTPPTGASPQRDVALVFQYYSLYPRYTVRQNLAFPLKSPVRSFRQARSTAASRRARRCCGSSTCSTARPTSSRAARCSGCRSAGRSCATRASS